LPQIWLKNDVQLTSIEADHQQKANIMLTFLYGKLQAVASQKILSKN
jgi:hypothetical protein